MTRWSEADLKSIRRREVQEQLAAPDTMPKDPMNKWERAFANEVLEPLRMLGEIERWRFEAIKLRIGHRCFYTPDFQVSQRTSLSSLTYALGGIAIQMSKQCFIEVKGHWREDARVKLKAVAAIYPECVFIAATGGPGKWRYELIQSR